MEYLAGCTDQLSYLLLNSVADNLVGIQMAVVSLMLTVDLGNFDLDLAVVMESYIPVSKPYSASDLSEFDLDPVGETGIRGLVGKFDFGLDLEAFDLDPVDEMGIRNSVGMLDPDLVLVDSDFAGEKVNHNLETGFDLALVLEKFDLDLVGEMGTHIPVEIHDFDLAENIELDLHSVAQRTADFLAKIGGPVQSLVQCLWTQNLLHC